MAVSNFYESIADRQATGTIRQSPTYSRTFMVRVDHPGTSLKEIGQAAGIQYGDPHPDDPTVYVIQVDINAVGDSMMYYGVTYQYGIVDNEDVSGGAAAAAQAEAAGEPVTPPDPLALPVDYWSGSSSLATEYRETDQADKVVRNTAGVPIAGGAETSVPQAQLILTQHIPLSSFFRLNDLALSIGDVNQDFWPQKYDNPNFTLLGSEPGSWRVNSVDWAFKQQISDTAVLSYYEARITFAYKRAVLYDATKHYYSSKGFFGGPNTINNDETNQHWVSPWCPWLASKGYMYFDKNENELKEITAKIEYRNCKDEVIQPPEGDENEVCEWPRRERVSEPQPLDINGQPVAPGDDDCAIIVVDTIPKEKAKKFHPVFGSPNPNDTGNWPNPPSP